MGKRTSASVATSLQMSFTNIKLAIVAGICGGVPFTCENVEIILGDVIISDWLIESDFGRQYADGFKIKRDREGALGPPNQKIQSVLAKLKTDHGSRQLQRMTVRYLEDLKKRCPGKRNYVGTDKDILLEDCDYQTLISINAIFQRPFVSLTCNIVPEVRQERTTRSLEIRRG